MIWPPYRHWQHVVRMIGLPRFALHQNNMAAAFYDEQPPRGYRVSWRRGIWASG